MAKENHYLGQIFLVWLAENLGDRDEIKKELMKIQSFPEAMDLLLAELDLGIKLLNRFRPRGFFLGGRADLCINSIKLHQTMNKSMLPDMKYFIYQLLNLSKKESDKLIAEFNKFEFPRQFKSSSQLISALVIAVYRTLMRIQYPLLVKNHVQVASSIEEMLALLAIRGFKTNLFQATRNWILDYKKEGFSRYLSIIISRI